MQTKLINVVLTLFFVVLFGLPLELGATVETDWPAGKANVPKNSGTDGFIDFEDGTDGTEIVCTIPGVEFTTPYGVDWVYGDIRTGAYNVYPYGTREYETNGNFFAWLGPTEDSGRIDFTEGTATYLSVLVSTYSGLIMDAYDANDNFLATSGRANSNINTGTFTRLTLEAPGMAYVLVHDTGNYWLIDDLCTDATGVPTPKLHGLFVGMDHGRDLNGDADAKAIYKAFKQFNHWADTNPEPLILDPNESGNANRQTIEQALDDIKSNLSPGDGFVFYFSGHGWFPTSSDGDETPVWVSVGPWDIGNKHDEYLSLGGYDLSDDLLGSWLDDSAWNNVDKLVILDACHSGGFWGDDKTNDSGDLENLPRIGLLAACPEWGVSFSEPIKGRGLYTLVLVKAVKLAGKIKDIADYVESWDWSQYLNKSLPLRMEEDAFPPEGSILPFGPSDWQPCFQSSDDFTMTLPELSDLQLEVAVDIKPNSCPNPLRVGSRGVLPIAIVGTQDFDVSQIDPASVQLEGVSPLRWSLEDVTTPFYPMTGKEDLNDCSIDGPDGRMDLTLVFDTQELSGVLGDANHADVLVLKLQGALLEDFGATPIVGEDVIVILRKAML